MPARYSGGCGGPRRDEECLDSFQKVIHTMIREEPCHFVRPRRVRPPRAEPHCASPRSPPRSPPASPAGPCPPPPPPPRAPPTPPRLAALPTALATSVAGGPLIAPAATAQGSSNDPAPAFYQPPAELPEGNGAFIKSEPFPLAGAIPEIPGAESVSHGAGALSTD